MKEAPDPSEAERLWRRLRDAGVAVDSNSPNEIQLLRVACQRAPYLTTLLARDPSRLARVARDPYVTREKPTAVAARELAARTADASDAAELADAMRRYRADEMVRLGTREFGLRAEVEVGRELAGLAEVVFDRAIEFHGRALDQRWGEPLESDGEGGTRRCELAVIGMGKLGGRELNFSSDVDVIYVYGSDHGAAGERSLHEYFCELCRRVTATLAEVTSQDIVFRVDLRLRPEGSRGAIANSLHSMERYYESWGRPWERQAWLKARPCGGSRALGEEVLRTLEPFVFPRHISPRVIADVAELNHKIKTELDTSGVESGFDLKNGVGGIREIEFFAQALQLIHAGARPELRTRSTRATLDQLLFAGIITDAEQRALGAAYSFLRRAEHAVQMEAGGQVHRLPADPEALERLARRLDFADRAALLGELATHTREVAALFATLGEDESPTPPEIRDLLAAEPDDERVRAALRALGFRDIEQAAHNLEYARKKPASPLGPTATGAAARVAPDLIAELAASPDPDQGLGLLVDLIGKRGSWSALWRIFDDNRQALRLIASLLGTSAYLSRLLVNHPELFDYLLQAGRANPRRTDEELAAIAQPRISARESEDVGAQWEELAAFKHEQVLRVGLADVAGDLDAESVCAELSTIAEVCLRESFALVDRDLGERHGRALDSTTGQPARLAVLALGKLGGRELGYASDLDIIFVYTGDTDSDGARPLDILSYMTRFAQRLVGGLHTMHATGRLYEADTRLRPSGGKGLLVSSLDGWRRYHQSSSHLWERQALIKLRCVAGDAELGQRVEEVAREHAYATEDDPAAIAAAVRDMRDRIERERSAGTGGLDFKVGRGGLVDIEFAAQYLQLVHGRTHPTLQTQATVPALRAAAEAGVLDPNRAGLLVDGYRFLRMLEHRVRIVHDRSAHRLPADPVELATLARRAGFASADTLLDTYQRKATQVGEACSAILAN